MSDLPAYLLFRGMSEAFGRLPSSVVRVAGQGIGRAMALRSGRRFALARRHMERVLGSDVDLDAATREMFASYGRYWAEVFWFRPNRKPEIMANTEMVGLGPVFEARDAKRGMIFALPHVGTWEAAAVVADCPPALGAIAELRAVTDALVAAGLESHVAVDLGEVRGLDYYTGLVFRVFAPGLGFEVGGGGRYDSLLARFGRPLPAVGFMLGLDRVALLLARQGAPTAPDPVPAEAVGGRDLGPALRTAREKRSSGVRVRFGNGGEG